MGTSSEEDHKKSGARRTVSDITKRSLSCGDMHVTNGGRILRRSDKLRSCGVSDGCTIQVTSRIRGGGRHKDKSKAEKKQGASQERDESGSGTENKRVTGVQRFRRIKRRRNKSRVRSK